MSGVPEANNFCTSCGAELEPDTEMCPVCEYPSGDGGRTWDDVKGTTEASIATVVAYGIASTTVLMIAFLVYDFVQVLAYGEPLEVATVHVVIATICAVLTWSLRAVWPVYRLRVVNE